MCTVAIADEHRPTAGAAFAFEPDADREVEEVVVVEERDLESRWSVETSTGAVQAAVQLSQHVDVLQPDALRCRETSSPVEVRFVERDARQRVLTDCL